MFRAGWTVDVTVRVPGNKGIRIWDSAGERDRIGVCVRAGGRWTIGDPGYGPPESTGCGVLAAEETG